MEMMNFLYDIDFFEYVNNSYFTSTEFWVYLSVIFFILLIYLILLLKNNHNLKMDLDNKIKEIYKLIYEDFLTELPNRRCLIEKLLNFTESKIPFYIIYIDLDRFKYINDTFGHYFGDKILKLVSRKFKEKLKDTEEIFRIGGDEFIVLCHFKYDIMNDFLIEKRIKNLIQPLNETLIVDDIEFKLSASAGVAIYPKDSNDPNLLLTYSDLAMYKAKLEGKNQFKFYKPEYSEENKELVIIEQELRYVLEKKQLELYLQPQILIENNIKTIIGAECLIRWVHPIHGIISPLKFIPIAEDTGLINEIGDFIVESACQFLNKLNEENIYIKLGINISALQFKSKGFINNLKEFIGTYNIKSKNIELEITESLLMSTEKELNNTFNELNMFGFKITIDDFGTGFSNFSYLKKFPINKVKIDKSFIKDMLIEKDTKLLIKNIIRMTKDLNLEIIAEGVETPEQLQMIQMLGCSEIQGYYFSKPLPLPEFIDYCKKFK